MNIREVVEPLSGIMSQLVAQANKSAAKFTDCHRVEHKPGASLYEPINGNPFVVVLEPDGVKRHTFKPDNQSSGTDHLRARILAAKFYEGVAA